MSINKPIVTSILSGCAWGAFAYVANWPWLGSGIWGGVVAAPFIGLAAGRLSRRFVRAGWLERQIIALASLYGAAVIFVAISAVTELSINGGTHTERGLDLVLKHIFGILWILTVMGGALLLWPLAYLNHTLVAKFWPDTHIPVE